MAKARRRKAKEVAGHKSKRRCKHCKGKHTTSEHWSHAANTGKKSFKHSFGGTKGGKRRRKGTYHGSPGDFRAGAAAIKAGKIGRSAHTRKGKLTRAERRAMNKAKHARVQRSKHSETATQHLVKSHFQKVPGRRAKKLVKAHLQADPGEKKDIRPKRRKRLG